MGYRDEVPVSGGLDGLPGFHIIKPGNPHKTQFTAWDKGKTVFRPYPAISDSGAPMPLRMDERPSAFSDWIYPAKLVKGMGVNNRFTCFLKTKGHEDDRTYQGPIEKFASAITMAITQNARAYPESWEAWVKGVTGGRNVKIPRIETWALIQGALYECGDRVFMDATRTRREPQHPVLLCLTKSARIGLEILCNTEVPGYTGNPEDYASRFAYGDFVSPERGRPIQIIKNPGDVNTRAHYDVKILDNVAALPLDFIRQEWVPWKELLQILTEDEQLGLLFTHFPPEPLDYAFKGTQWYEALPQSMRGSFDRMMRGTANVAPVYPGQPAQGYMPPAQGFVPQAQGYPAQPAQGYPTQPVQGFVPQAQGYPAPPLQEYPAPAVNVGTIAPAAAPRIPPPPVFAPPAQPGVPHGNSSWGMPGVGGQPMSVSASPPPLNPYDIPLSPNPASVGRPNVEVHVPQVNQFAVPGQNMMPPAQTQPIGDATVDNMAAARDRLAAVQRRAQNG